MSLESIIKKSIKDITLADVENLYNSFGIATIRVADNELLFVNE